MNECFINYLDVHNSQINHRRHVYCDLESLNHRKNLLIIESSIMETKNFHEKEEYCPGDFSLTLSDS